MVKCKVFQSNSKGSLESQVNKFLAENSFIKIVTILQSMTDNGIVITIFYE